MKAQFNDDVSSNKGTLLPEPAHLGYLVWVTVPVAVIKSPTGATEKNEDLFWLLILAWM